jgi:hypothetical protein
MPYTLYDYIYTSREGLKHAVCVIRRSHGETTEEMIKGVFTSRKVGEKLL